MCRSRGRSWWAFCFTLAFLLGCPWAPPPVFAAPDPGKLRVFVQPVSSPPSEGRFYQTPDAQFVSGQFTMTESILSQKGIYEVVSRWEVRAALKGEMPQWWRWERSDWALVREVGKGLGADYALVVERGFQGDFYIRMVMINLATGRRYDVRDHIPGSRAPLEMFLQMWRELYRKLFAEAKGDMLATALRKGMTRSAPSPEPPAFSPELVTEPPMEQALAPGLVTEPPTDHAFPLEPLTEPAASPRELARETPPRPRPSETEKGRADEIFPLPVPSPREIPGETQASAAAALPQPPAAAPIPPPEAARKPPAVVVAAIPPPPPSGTLTEPPAVAAAVTPGIGEAPASALTPERDEKRPAEPAGEKRRLIVYDFEAGDDLRVAGLILAEALREELYNFGRFVLINREDMVRALEEHKLKMVGLAEEEGSARIGKFLLAGEMVTGKLGRLGNTCILQTKRTDIESLSVRNIRSLKSPSGREEELLDGLPDLARRLFETP